ncbi:restriction endonuclease [Pseudomonas ogarae]|uniref:Restriction endonuclease n=1 Tax=Pseudomonas ogarae (strain DSM 112162 / CECT 30235 / F113) TaxID=1114970 RepID=A0ABM6QSE9_PSEO1|nr:restriction endonuclease [Pseudomonas ogarae]AEV60116.1 Putative restriction endonuclease [Pseudomonas ogarae]AUO44005.1 restriction endonuclease [Pseudomonas ogarae]
MKEIRVAIFDQFMPTQYDHNQPEMTADEPSDWAASLGGLNFSPAFEGPRGKRYCRVDDERLQKELHRLTKFKTCSICRSPTFQVESLVEDEDIQLCLKCGYWGGIGFREWNSHLHSHPRRGVIGRYKAIEPIDAQSTDYLATHLRRYPKELTNISPKRSETFVMDLLSDYLGCEVKSLGGTKDGGVDGYILKGNKVGTIIQVKWHESTDKAESVKVVREVAGTLLARHVPQGILVSNREKYSEPAKQEAKSISQLSINELGKINLELMDYHNILDMLEITSTKATSDMRIDDWFKFNLEEECIFDGAAMISEGYAERFM